MRAPQLRSVGIAVGSLLASSATLVCCVLPAVFVSLGAGAVLAGLVSRFPQLVWLSEHKTSVFVVAGGLIAAAGLLLWHARRLPCPADPVAARTCSRLRTLSLAVYGLSLAAFGVGALFAFGGV